MLRLTTPALLFSAISLILLAYTNRFIAYAAVVRALKASHEEGAGSPQQRESRLRQIDNLYCRLKLTRAMQMLGIASLLFCVLAMFCFYIGHEGVAIYLFGAALLLLAASLLVSLTEIHISVRALKLHLEELEASCLIRPDVAPNQGSDRS